MLDPTANFYDVQTAFNNYWAGKTIEKGKGYKAFRRWEAYMEPRVYPSGNTTLPSQTAKNYKQWETNLAAAGIVKSVAGNWSLMGPVGKPVGGGAGRLNFIRIHPTIANTIYVGSADGGLWKTIDGGTTWTTNTDLLGVIGSSDIAFDPTNPSIMYLATGDSDGADCYSIGVLKSIDAGATWQTTGLTWVASQGRRIAKILINPTNPQIVMAFGSSGIYRSTNGGTTWTQPTGTFTGIKDAEMNPGDANILYAAGTIFSRSLDGGLNWAPVATGLTNISRLSIAVTPANNSYVYVLASNNTDYGFLGFIQSIDNGATFTTRSTTPNILGWDNGGDAGGQGWYDLAIGASPTNSQEIMIGGVNMWRSTNGGTSWTLNSHWYGGFSKPYVHADIHDIVYLNGTTAYSANDGGLFKTINNGTAWTDISSNLAIAQQYRLGLSTTNPNLIITGHQDNGTNRYNGTNWTQVYGGDGMDCFIDRTNNNNMVGSYVYGDYYRSTNGGTSFTTIMTGIPAGGKWLSVIHQDPVTANTYYAGGRAALYKTTNSGTAWTALGTPTGTGDIIEFAIAPSNNQVIYSLKSGASGITKSIDGGATFTAVSAGLPTTSTPTYIAISNTNPDVAILTYSGYTATNKVFKTTNGGTTWTNLSTGLPNIPVNCVVYNNNSAIDAFYIGTDLGVFYRDNNQTSWIVFNTGLPNVIVNDLEIYYPTSRLRAATYGRGTWDSDLFADPPLIGLQPTQANSCIGQNMTFSTSSTNSTGFQWQLSTDNGVTWNNIINAGVYSNATTATLNITGTTLIMNNYLYRCNVTNINGTTTSNTANLVVTPNNTITLTSTAGTNAQTACINTPITGITYATTSSTGATATGLPAGVTGTWASNVFTISGTPTVSGIFNYTVTMTGGCTGGTNTSTGTITVAPNNTLGLTSAVGTNAQVKCINTALTNITYSTTGATGATATGLPAGVTGIWTANVFTISGTPTTTGTFSYTVTMTGGCTGGTNTATGTITVNANTVLLTSAVGTNAQTVCLNTAITNITYSTTGATGATATGLPAGVTGTWASNAFTISGTPTTSGTFSYTLTMTGGCTGGTNTATGTITVNANNTLTLSSAVGTNTQVKCINTALTTITYSTTVATGATATGLPAGVTGTWASNVFTLSGTPTVSGTFNYTVTMTGGCTGGTNTATGTITVNANTLSLSSAVGTNAQSLCINNPITSLTYSTTGATGAIATGLPAGVTGTWASNVFTISGTPIVSGSFNYTVTMTGGCTGGTNTATGTITVNANNTLALTSAVGTNAQVKCINTALTNITYSTTGATGATAAGLPAGVTGTWASNAFTISGTPTVSGSFNYTVTMTGGCTGGTNTASGTLTVNANNTLALSSAVGTNAQVKCINTSLTSITYSTTGATGATATGLPAGVTGTWASNVFTISGTPTVSGSFNYTVTMTGGCTGGTNTASGTITVNANNTLALTSAVGTNAQVKCINTALTNITYSTTGATGATATGLPAGVTGTWAANVFTISGTPTVSGSFNYTVTMTGGCTGGTNTASGTMTVTPNNTIALSSAVGTNAQSLCINNPITSITYATTDATVATATGLPAGVTGTWASNVFTISGTPTVSGSFNYTVTMTGGCTGGTNTASGTMTVTPNNTMALSSAVGTNAQSLCINNPITSITYATTDATGATATGLPAGVTGTWASNVFTISGTPTVSGIFNYTVTMTGGCTGGTNTASGTMTVTPNNTMALSSAVGTDTQTVCISTPFMNITYATTEATGATATGLPAGVTGTWASNVFTISGIPTVSGMFNYTVTMTGGCTGGTNTASGTMSVTPNNTFTLTTAAGTDTQTVCINNAITSITYSTTGATGVIATGLPAGVTGTWIANVFTISGTPTISGSFNYTISSIGGCGMPSTTGSILVNSLPTAIITANGPTTICAGDSIELFSNSGIGLQYEWQESGQSIMNMIDSNIVISNNGNYTVVILDTNNCMNTSLPIQVIVNSLPVVTLNPFNDVCDTIQEYVLTGGLPLGGTYAGIAVLNGLFNTTTGAGNYSITYEFTDLNGCTSSSIQDLVVIDCSGASIVKNEGNELIIYPNPTNGFCYLKCESNLIGQVVNIYDFDGKIVYSDVISTKEKLINMNNIAPGIYYLTIQNEGVYRGRIVKY